MGGEPQFSQWFDESAVTELGYNPPDGLQADPVPQLSRYQECKQVLVAVKPDYVAWAELAFDGGTIRSLCSQ